MSIKKRARPSTAVRQSWSDDRPKNRLLASLPADDLRGLLPYLTTVPLSAKQVLQRTGEPIEFVYFPNGGIVSMESVLLDGTALASAAIGDEGVIGSEAMLELDAWAFAHSEVRTPDGDAERMNVNAFRHALAECGALRDLVGRFLHVLIAMLMQNAVCRARHDARQRCAGWLLTIHERVYAQEFLLSHEALAEMLGMRRPTVSSVASRFQQEGLIRYRHGRVTVLNQEGLEAATCECYESVRVLLNRLRT